MRTLIHIFLWGNILSALFQIGLTVSYWGDRLATFNMLVSIVNLAVVIWLARLIKLAKAVGAL